MAYKVFITREAKQDIEALDAAVKRQLHKKLLYYLSLDDIKVVAKKLTDPRVGEYRLRVGNYRIIFDLDKHAVVLLRIQHRKDVYRQK